jgi:4-hydroxy-2-oxoheptanedioate aldolase
MVEIPRLNSVIRELEAGKHVFTTFAQPNPEGAAGLATSDYDGIVFEMEHNPWDVRALKDSLQYMLNRRQIAESGSIAPKVAPIVRIPPNGAENNQWFAKQALDLGVYGIVWPHVDTVEQAMNAVGACRYPRLPSAPLYAPAGLRGDAPGTAARFWGLTQQEYYQKADVWPLNPEGEILVVLMIESVQAIKNLPSMLKDVPGIGVILVGEGDLSQELGFPRQYEHPTVVEHIDQIVQTCKEHNVPVGHAHVGSDNLEHVIEWGFRWLMAGSTTNYGTLNKGRELTGRVAK